MPDPRDADDPRAAADRARAEAMAGAVRSETVKIRLVDVEPFTGLVAAVGRFCAHLDQKALDAMEPEAMEALGVIQAVMFRLEHSQPER